MQPAARESDEAPPRGGMAAAVYAQLHEMLLTHRLVLDRPISERSLSAELGVSRTPLREALHRLEGEGLLERLPGGVLRVRRPDVEEFLEIQQVRRLLESEAAAQAAGRVEPAVLAGLRAGIAALLADPRPAAELQGARVAVDLQLHRAIAAAAGNATSARMIEDMRRRMMLFAMPRPPAPLEEDCRQYRAIIDALEAADPDAARAAMATHVDALRAAMLHRLAQI